MNSNPIIALLTDYGTQDPFVGILKGVIADISPGTWIVDINHEIPPGDIRRGAINLWQSVGYFPRGTIFMAVIDPGVGSTRRAIFIETDRSIFLGPDNGLFTFVLPPESRVWEITNPEYLIPEGGSTFHGRDIFAPVAAHAANGVPAVRFGVTVTNITQLTKPRMEIVGLHAIYGEVLYPDRFGNILTSIGKFSSIGDHKYRLVPWLNHQSTTNSTSTIYSSSYSRLILSNGIELPWVSTFSDIREGECGCLIGSSGLMEIVSNKHSAAEILGLHEGLETILMTSGK